MKEAIDFLNLFAQALENAKRSEAGSIQLSDELAREASSNLRQIASRLALLQEVTAGIDSAPGFGHAKKSS